MLNMQSGRARVVLGLWKPLAAWSEALYCEA